MSDTAQKRALRNYRSRLAKQGMARFEILCRSVDRDLIRLLANVWLKAIPTRRRSGKPCAGRSAENLPPRGAFWPHSGARHWSGPISI